MGHLAGLKPQPVIKAFCRLGWTVARHKGSHCTLCKPGNPCIVTIPVHGKEVKPGLLRSALAKAGISSEEFLENYR